MRIVYRRAQATDTDFIVGTWLSSYRREPSAGLTPGDRWKATMGDTIQRALRVAQVLVVADADATDNVADLFGYLVYERGTYRMIDDERVWSPEPGGNIPLIYYCYVKHDYRSRMEQGRRRGFGFARGLLNAARIDPTRTLLYACETSSARTLIGAGKLPGALHRPNVARRRLSLEGDHLERDEARTAAAR